jgi:hypothetical protein
MLRDHIARVDFGDTAAENRGRLFDPYLAVTSQGLRTVVECELEIVQICLGPGGPGDFRSKEGFERFFFYSVEHRTGRLLSTAGSWD